MKVLAIALTALRRVLRERTATFVMFVMPMLLILLLGLLYGDPEFRVGIVAGEGQLTEELTEGIRAGDRLVVTEFSDRDELLDAVAHIDLDVGLIIPVGYDESVRAGEPVTVEYAGTSDYALFRVSEIVEAQLGAHTLQIGAAQFAGQTVGASFDSARAVAAGGAADLVAIDVNVVETDGTEFAEAGMFDAMASRMLVLFVFLAGLQAGASRLIQSRNLGMAQRMLGTPTAARTIVAGETAGRFLIAFVQSLVIVVAAAVFFGVRWGSWPATLAILAVFSVLAAGTGMLLGSLFRKEQLAESIGLFIALAFAMVGGSMGGSPSMPVPHAWANEAFDKVMVEGAGIAAIATELSMIAAIAVGCIALAAAAYRRTVTGWRL